jgi:SOS-response transcriptional repressor LexA
VQRVPIISPLHAKDAAVAGYHSLYKMQPQGWITVTVSVGQRAYALTVIGDSMEPKFPEGVTIIGDPDVQPVQGSFVVALLVDTYQVTFNQFIIDGRHYLKPLNPRYPVMEWTITSRYAAWSSR